MSFATLLRAKRRVASALFTSRPRIKSITRPAFWAEVRMYFAVACAWTGIYAPAFAAGATDAALSLFVVCPLNVRVGANSPSLWPTMFSVM